MRPMDRFTTQDSRMLLMFDADDTLWENNIYFEQAFDDFVAFLNHEHLTAAEIQDLMLEIERSNVQSHGYGARSYANSLRQAFKHICDVNDDDPDLVDVEQLALRILTQEFELLPNVEETLRSLRSQHQTVMVTKGHHDEQSAKVARSGIADLFDDVVIVPEKSPATYEAVVTTHGHPPSSSWMIGNSPRSDINPALLAGMNAVFIPHPHTWQLEIEDVVVPLDAPGTLLELPTFARLVEHFGPKPGSATKDAR